MNPQSPVKSEATPLWQQQIAPYVETGRLRSRGWEDERPQEYVRLNNVREVFAALTEQNKKLNELVSGAYLLLNGDCPLSELNCDDWLRRAAALSSEGQKP